jgi:hypothetical protein
MMIFFQFLAKVSNNYYYIKKIFHIVNHHNFHVISNQTGFQNFICRRIEHQDNTEND